MIVSSAYLMFVIFCPLMFIPFPSSSAFSYQVMLNRHGDNIQPCRTPRFIVISSDVSFSYRTYCGFLLEVKTFDDVYF